MYRRSDTLRENRRRRCQNWHKPSRFSTKRGNRGLSHRNALCGRNSEVGMALRSILCERYREQKQNWEPQEGKHRARRTLASEAIVFVPRKC